MHSAFLEEIKRLLLIPFFHYFAVTTMMIQQQALGQASLLTWKVPSLNTSVEWFFQLMLFFVLPSLCIRA
jgi:uncharacterized membrane protein